MVVRRPARWADLEALPEEVIGEIVNGEVVVTPRPDPPHIWTSTVLGETLGPPFRAGIGGPGGWIILDEPRIRFGEQIRVPDLAAWRRDRWPGLPKNGPIRVAPDWTCEILSPSTEREDRTNKLDLYARAHVGHVWLVNPATRTLEVCRRADGDWLLIGRHADDQRVRAEPFDAIEIELRLLWGELEPGTDDGG